LQLTAIWAVILGAIIPDAWGRQLRGLGLVGLIAGCALAVSWPTELPAGLPWWTRACYLGAVVAGTFVCAYAIDSRVYFFAAVGMLVASLGRVLHVFAIELQRIANWEGAGFFVLGLVWLVLAVLISSAKAGLGRHLRRLVPQSVVERARNGPGVGR
jgi:hypothetical protein